MFVYDATAQFQGIGHLAILHGEMVRQQGKPLYLLIMGETLLKDVDTLPHHRVDLLVLAQFNPVGELYATRPRPFLNNAILWHNKGRDELALVGHDGNMVNEFVYKQQRLYHLRGYILAIAGLEQVLYALSEEKLPVLDITSVAGMEESVCVKSSLVLFRRL